MKHLIVFAQIRAKVPGSSQTAGPRTGGLETGNNDQTFDRLCGWGSDEGGEEPKNLDQKRKGKRATLKGASFKGAR